ncbi:energy-coupling factor transporter transmembrane protein EcfT [Nocardia sp. CNY236]|uniref:energy-coupling factor transporter transmembrane component T family protein n=1 Tax=Nocardia sp. CNY236 TaxID=1169152 RepID=UPI0004245434|nr:energy-coupling factor transporter transmembrane protein EcfT [Nocardia sp. CNY236]
MSAVLLRRVPVASPVHRLWAGTKLIGAFLISVVLIFVPSWPVLGVMVAFLVVVGALARLPLGTLPRLPWWFWALFVVGGLTTAPVGADAMLRYAQVTVFGLILVAASFLIAWTTPMGEIAPALATLGRPLRTFRVPVDEWAVVVALTLRGLPLLLEEIRILRAARRLRGRNGASRRAMVMDISTAVMDILTAVLAVATRRAAELGEAISARGGTGQLTAHPSSPGRRDALALAAVCTICLGSVGLHLLL